VQVSAPVPEPVEEVAEPPPDAVPAEPSPALVLAVVLELDDAPVPPAPPEASANVGSVEHAKDEAASAHAVAKRKRGEPRMEPGSHNMARVGTHTGLAGSGSSAAATRGSRLADPVSAPENRPTYAQRGGSPP
jgi:hypothetical protein